MTQTAFARFRDAVLGGCRGAAAAALAFVYPPTCPGCQVLLGRHAGICGRCWSSLRFIERPYCEVLGVPFSHDLGSGTRTLVGLALTHDPQLLRAGVVQNDITQLVQDRDTIV